MIVKAERGMGVFKFSYLSSSAGAPCNQLLPAAAVVDKFYPKVERRREDIERYKNEINVGLTLHTKTVMNLLIPSYHPVMTYNFIWIA
jgi:hypothetical protein